MFDLGMVEGRCRVRPDLDLHAVVLEVVDHECELVLSPPSAVDVLLRIIAALDQLNIAEETGDWVTHALARLAQEARLG
jgi:hypothetical protein